ncbi:unnamed protein product [Ixodes persulcatus]
MDSANAKPIVRRGSKCAFIHCTNKRKCSLRLFFPFPDNDATLREMWLANMRMEGYKPTLYDRLCADHFDPTCFTKRSSVDPLITLRDDAVPTLFEFPKKPTAVVTVTSHKPEVGHPSHPATALSETNPKKMPIKTMIMESSLSKPFTMTLPPSSRLVIVPVRTKDGRQPGTLLTQPSFIVKHAPANTSTSVTGSTMAAVGTSRRYGPSEEDDVDLEPRDMARVPPEQERVMKGIYDRKIQLAQARMKLRKLRCGLKAGKKRLRQLHDLMFSERVVMRNGSKVVEMTLSNWAMEVFSDAPTDRDVAMTDCFEVSATPVNRSVLKSKQV